MPTPVGFQKHVRIVVAIGCKDELWDIAIRHTVEWVKERMKSSVSRIQVKIGDAFESTNNKDNIASVVSKKV